MRRPVGLAFSLCSMAAGGVLLVTGIDAGLRYSPYENPGALRTAVVCLLLSAALVAGPVLILLGRMLARDIRSYLAWRRTLTPQELALLRLAEAGAMWAAHLAWRERNRAVDDELTARVMGGERDASEWTSAGS